MKFNEKVIVLWIEICVMFKEYGNKKFDEVILKQIYGGVCGIKIMIWEILQFDFIEGIRFWGYFIFEFWEVFFKGLDGKEFCFEGLFWLMLVGEILMEQEVKWLIEQWLICSYVFEYIFKVLDSLLVNIYLMMQFFFVIVFM